MGAYGADLALVEVHYGDAVWFNSRLVQFRDGSWHLYALAVHYPDGEPTRNAKVVKVADWPAGGKLRTVAGQSHTYRIDFDGLDPVVVSQGPGCMPCSGNPLGAFQP